MPRRWSSRRRVHQPRRLRLRDVLRAGPPREPGAAGRGPGRGQDHRRADRGAVHRRGSERHRGPVPERGCRPAMQPAPHRLHPGRRIGHGDRAGRGARLRDRQALPGGRLRRAGLRAQLPGAQPGIPAHAHERGGQRGIDPGLVRRRRGLRGRGRAPVPGGAHAWRGPPGDRGADPDVHGLGAGGTRSLTRLPTAGPGRAGPACDGLDTPAPLASGIMTGMSETFDFDRMLALPRLSSLRLSPDGSRLIVSVARPDPEGKRMAASLWQGDPADTLPARRLTRSVAGEAGATAFLPDGSLLFTSSRPDPDAKPDPGTPGSEKASHARWLLPPPGREAGLLGAAAGGVAGLGVPRRAPVAAFGSRLRVGAATCAEDAERAKARREAGVTALLFEDDYPVRHWDHWLAPRRHLFVAALPAGPEARLADARDLEPGASTL